MTGWFAPRGVSRAWLLGSLALVAFVVWASLKPGSDTPSRYPIDKLGHWLAYFVLMAWFTGLHPRARHWQVASVLLAFGLALEVAQHLMHWGRNADPLDMLANSLGIACGALLAAAGTAEWALRFESWLRHR